MSADGAVVVGQIWPSGEGIQAFIWDPVHGIRTIDEVLASAGVDLGGWQLTEASGVSADGLTVVGNGTNPSGVRQAWIATLDCEGAGIDTDGDGFVDRCDDCPYVANPDQTDTGAIGFGSAPDGIGDACQCGDVNGDGRVTVADAVTMQRALLEPPTATMLAPERCDVNGDGQCTIGDAVVVRRSLLQPPTETIQQLCAPAAP